ncbi:MAG TPA: hypothetical protein VGF27_00855, partial [Pseudoduganella sp.]
HCRCGTRIQAHAFRQGGRYLAAQDAFPAFQQRMEKTVATEQSCGESGKKIAARRRALGFSLLLNVRMRRVNCMAQHLLGIVGADTLRESAT